jgi:serpin B
MGKLLAAFVLLAGLGCHREEPAAPIPLEVARSSKPRATALELAPGDREALAQGNAAFAFELYARTKPANDNFVFSPLSLSLALAMTYAGARGATETEMAATLLFSPQAQLHPAMNDLEAALHARGENATGADGGPFRLMLVNSVWAQKGNAPLPAFLDTLAENYGAGVNLLDFAHDPEGARGTINAWVGQQTQERITTLLPPGAIDPLTALVLTNAVSFSAAWKVPFPTTTQNGAFVRLDGSSVDVPIMRMTELLPMARGDGFSAVDLPYDDERLSLTVVVPDPGRFAEVEGAFDARALAEVVRELQPQEVSLALPRWTCATPLRLNEVLAALGMPSAFQVGVADFSGIDGAPGHLFIKALVHQAFIAVGEKGTEAAAATGVFFGRKSVGPSVSADRPFLFVLRDRPTGALLFLGRVLDPSRAPAH